MALIAYIYVLGVERVCKRLEYEDIMARYVEERMVGCSILGRERQRWTETASIVRVIPTMTYIDTCA